MNCTRSTSDDPASDQSSTPFGRSARVNRRSDGEPIGASIFLTAEQLEQLGLRTVHIETLKYRVCDGELYLAEAGGIDTVGRNSSTQPDKLAEHH